MFSVNIDKLVATTPAQEKAYKELCNRVLAKGRKYKTLAVIGESGYALRLAAAIVDAGNKVLFVDADVTTPVFMGKYRLGKNLEGLCEYLDGTQDDDKIRCLTNRSDLNIIFSGESSRQTLSRNDEDRLREFLDNNMDDYDYIILEAGKSAEVARNCRASLVLIDDSEYNPRDAREKIEFYDNEGCLVLGVVITNV
ncbi:MAG: hypothetical protein PUD90_10275 [Clostridia bacterium]|nr:hypothetical protein [[Bacteroides] pectinophilus]MDD5873826.1 hypothetical protein [Clostridia bacterium]